MRQIRLARRFVPLAGAALALAAARSSETLPMIRRGAAFTPNPASLDLNAGATQPIAITLREDLAAGGARPGWSIVDAGVATLDSVSATGTRAYLRAMAPGATVVVIVGGATGQLPVRVR